MAVAVTSMMHCYLEKAVKCVKVLDGLRENVESEDNVAEQSSKLLENVKQVFKEEDGFAEPEAMNGVAMAVVDEVCGEGNFKGSNAALSCVPGFLAYRHGHEEEALEFQVGIIHPEGSVYFNHLLKDDLEPPPSLEGHDDDDDDDDGNGDELDGEEDELDGDEDELDGDKDDVGE